MDLVLFLALTAAAIWGFVYLLKRANAADTEARGHERIRSRRERSQLAALFNDIVSDIRKPKP